jgi:AcrR family transcriptional regulator
MPPKTSLREKHTIETRRRLVDVARGLFVSQGYDATTIDEIAHEADVSPRTFFRYFATKEALLFHDFEERLDRIKDRIGQRPTDERPADTLVAVLTEMVADLDTEPTERDLIARLLAERPSLRSYHRSTIAEHSEGVIAEALAAHAGVDPDDLGLRTMVVAVGACFDVALRDWIEDPSGATFDAHFTSALTACAAAFPAP